MSWVVEECSHTECEDGEHRFPEVGNIVMVSETVTTREPGTASPEFIVEANEVGVVVSYVAEWHDVEVALASRDGQRAWISCDNLEGPA